LIGQDNEMPMEKIFQQSLEPLIIQGEVPVEK
jgi:hypothetical protein